MGMHDRFVKRAAGQEARFAEHDSRRETMWRELVDAVVQLSDWPREDIKILEGEDWEHATLRMTLRTPEARPRTFSLPVRLSGAARYVVLQTGHPVELTAESLEKAIGERSGLGTG